MLLNSLRYIESMLGYIVMYKLRMHSVYPCNCQIESNFLIQKP